MTLTREQVGQALNNAVDHGEVDDADYQAIMDTDAALRQQLSEVRTELASYAWTVTPAMVQATLDQLNQQLAALQLHWSTKKPTVSGQYWWRSQESVNGQKFPKVCHVFENNKVLYVEGLGVGSFYLKNASGEWAGPLVPPEEAT